MQKFFPGPKIALLFLAILCQCLFCFSQTPSLLKDIYAGITPSNASGFTLYNGAIYFQAATAANGIELWKTDGTPGGTVMVADIYAGTGSSSPAEFTVFNNLLYFRATTSAAGSELWRTDGTAAGTVLVANINAGSASSSPGYFTIMGSALYFRAITAANGQELWRYTSTGTLSRLTDVYAGASSSSISNLIAVNNILLFTATNSTYGNELWAYNGSSAGLVKNIRSGSASSGIAYMKLYNNRAYFRALNGTNGYELWTSDGTSGGTVMVKDIYAGSGNAVSSSELFACNGYLFFRATTAAQGAELWRTDGTSAGTVLVKDIVSGSGSSSPQGFAAIGNTLYFTAFTSAAGYELWKSDGTSAGTVLVKDIVPGTGNSSISGMISLNNTLFFNATQTATGAELWKSDGTAAGTQMVADLNPGNGGSSSSNFSLLNYGLIYRANNGATGIEPYRLQLPAPPVAYAVTGGGAYCSGGQGVTVGLANSELNTSYQLRRGASNVGSPVSGTGSAISFALQTLAGTYTVIATNSVGSTTMTGSATVTVNAVPFTHITTSVAYTGISSTVAFNNAGTYRLELTNLPRRATSDAILRIYYQGNHRQQVVSVPYTYACGSYVCGSYRCGFFSTCYTYCTQYCTGYQTYVYNGYSTFKTENGNTSTWNNNTTTCASGVQTVILPMTQIQTIINDGSFTLDHIVTGGAGNCTNNSVYFTLEYEYGPDICLGGSPLTLTATPAGGTLSGPGVTGNTFDPAAAGTGLHTISYSYTAPNGCTGTTSIPINVVNSITYYPDNDGDGYGSNDPSQAISGCAPVAGYVISNTDCNDANPAINPGATEFCNGIDDDCDGIIDNGAQGTAFYLDEDGDGYGTDSVVIACSQPAGYAAVNGDCNDDNPGIHPNATEVCNGLDDNCNGAIDEGFSQTLYYHDGDGDGYGNSEEGQMACSQLPGYVSIGGDCNDSNPNIHPGATELCNGLDDDCDGEIDENVQGLPYYLDEDGDGYGTGNPVITCNPAEGYVLQNGDCDDSDPAINPGAEEICNGIDDNCDGVVDEPQTFYQDLDGDGFGSSVTIQGCEAPEGYVEVDGDCDDSNAAVNPDADEICNGIDDDCDGQVDEGVGSTYYQDLDGDGYGSTITMVACSQPTGYVTINGDCNDNNNAVHPGATEICNGLDDDCDGFTDEGFINTVVTCPVTGTINKIGAPCGYTTQSSEFNATVTANCGPLSYTLSGATSGTGSSLAGVVFNPGNTLVTWSATNALNQTFSCSFTVHVFDNQLPTITAPANVSVFADAGVCVATNISLGNPATGDNCGVASVTNDHPSSTYPVGVTTVTWTVTDVNGNSQTATQTVTVTDNQLPLILPSATVAVFADLGQCVATSVDLGNPSTSDNCGIASITNDHPSSTYPVGSTTVTWTVTDVNGNSVTAIQIVNVTDNQLPSITAPANIVVFANSNQCMASPVSLGTPVTNDNCGVAVVSNNHPSGTYPVGVTTVTWTVVDVHGNQRTAIQTVTVIDDQLPMITAPANITVNADQGVCEATNVTLGSPLTSDNCGIATLSNNHPSGTYPVGVTTVTWTVVDVNGNAQTAVQTVTVVDQQLPSITAPANVTVNADPGICTATNVALGSPLTSDNCGVALVTNDHPSSAYPVGVTTVTWTVTDVHGNSQTTTQTVTVNDDQLPSITAPPAIHVMADEGVCIATVNSLGSPSTSDNCGVATVTNNHPSATYPVGVTTVTWTVTDVNGNAQTITQTVTVTDDQLPTIIAPANVTVNANQGVCVANNVSLGTPATNDNCGVASVTNDHPSATYPVGVTTVTWTVIDVNGNAQTATQTVTVNDTQLPTIIAPANVTVIANQGVCVANNVSLGTPVTNDNCGVATVTNNHPSATYPVGVTTVTWTVTDVNGNAQTATQTVTVNDTQLPIVITRNITRQLNAAGTVSITAAEINNGSSDNCGINNALTSISPSSFNCLNVGDNTVTLSITDIHGNTNTATAIVHIDPLNTSSSMTVSTPVQYSDQVVFTAAVTNGQAAGGCNAATSVSFKIGTRIMGTVPLIYNPVTNRMEASFTTTLFEIGNTLSVSPGIKAVSAEFNNVNPAFVVNTASSSLQINPEYGRMEYSGSQFVSTANVDISNPVSVVVPLRMNVQDISVPTTPVDPLSDPYPGNISRAKARFIVRETGLPVIVAGVTDANGWMPVGLLNPADSSTGTVSLNWTVTLSQNQYSYSPTIEMELGGPNGYYIRDNDEGRTVVTISRPTSEFVTGGGVLMPGTVAGEHAPAVGKKINFGFNLKYNKSGKNLQGNVNIVYRKLSGNEVRIFQIKGNSMVAMGVNLTNPTSKRANFTCKATLTDITDPLNPISYGGNHNLDMKMTDNGEPGSMDSLSITLYRSDGSLLMAGNWISLSAKEKKISNGNIVISGATATTMVNVLNNTKEDLAPKQETQPLNLTILAHPNPSNTEFQLTISSRSAEMVRIRVIDLFGRQIEPVRLVPANSYFRLGKNYRPGTYIVEVLQGKEKASIKLVKQE